MSKKSTTVLAFFYLRHQGRFIPFSVMALDGVGAAIVWDERVLETYHGPEKTDLLTWINLVYQVGTIGGMEFNPKIDLLAELFTKHYLRFRAVMEMEYPKETSSIKVAYHWLGQAKRLPLFPAPR